ncbi:hypothetical protein F8M41_021404 [Gigaspora margarita]|nr:hypothetical protein F8M41_021404 [Gigaspora margarita]
MLAQVKDRDDDKNESRISTCHHKPVEMGYGTAMEGLEHYCLKEICIIKDKKAMTHRQSTDQNYRSYRFGPCYENELGVKKEHDKRKICVENHSKDRLDNDKLKSEERTKNRRVLEVVMGVEN